MNNTQLLEVPPKTQHRWLPILAGFLALALPYHAAEYAMRFHQHIPAFLGCMFAVVIAAYAVAKWQGFAGLSAWGLRARTTGWLVPGLGIGLVVYIVAFLVRLRLNMEVIAAVPDVQSIISNTLVFAVGTFLPSLAEDILTRGYLYKHLQNRVSGTGFILLSSTVYVLNHIYALNSGMTQLVYLFLLGLMLTVPLVNTRSLWYSVGVHWAGNIIYRFSSDVVKVEAGSNPFPGLWELSFFVVVLLLVNYLVTKKFRKQTLQ